MEGGQSVPAQQPFRSGPALPPPPLQQHSFCPDTSSCLQPQEFLVPLPGSFHPAHLSGGSPSSLASLQVTQPSGAPCPVQTLTQPLNAPSHSWIWRARQGEDARNWQTLRAPQLGLSCDKPGWRHPSASQAFPSLPPALGSWGLGSDPQHLVFILKQLYCGVSSIWLAAPTRGTVRWVPILSAQVCSNCFLTALQAFVLISAKSQSSDHIRPSPASGPWLVLRVRYEAFTLQARPSPLPMEAPATANFLSHSRQALCLCMTSSQT